MITASHHLNQLNIGILAHVDAGKTSLTERLLFNAGVIAKAGSVDAGSTQTDTMALERQRGITIKAAVVSFAVDDTTVNLIDTPGHPDFIAEVERVLSVLDGAVLVISAVEGIQAQTRVLMRALQRLHIPTLIFVNKIDRAGAQHASLLQSIAEKLSPAIIPMGVPVNLGARDARFEPYDNGDADFMSELAERLAEHDDAMLQAFIDDPATLSSSHLQRELAAQTSRMLVHPVFFGSAITGAGVDALERGIATLLPRAQGDPHGPVSGIVFKIERGPAKEKIAYVRMFSGTTSARDRLPFGNGHEGRITALSVFERGSGGQRVSVAAGQIAKLWGLNEIQIGDIIGTASSNEEHHYFAPPTLETVVTPCRPADRGALHAALTQLAEQDPLINLRRDEIKGELFVSLYGEVQKEVIEDTLRNDFHVEVEWSETTTICIERPCGVGQAIDLMGGEWNPFLATLGLRIDPAPINTGLRIRLELKVDTIPLYVYKAAEEFQRALEDTMRKTLQQGLYGWQVTDCTITITQSDYVSPATTAKDFRLLAPLVVMDALKEAGTSVFEPLHHFHLEIPADAFGPVMPVLARLRAVPQAPSMRGASLILEGMIPAAAINELQQLLPSLSHGEGVLESAFDRYELVRSNVPTRSRTDNNPLNRKEYLLSVVGPSALRPSTKT